MTIRALLDTSVLVPVRTRIALLGAARSGVFVAVWSPWIIAELNRVLTWLWLERTGGVLSPANQRACSNAANAMMVLLLDAFVLVDPHGVDTRADWLNDPFDFPI